MKRLSRDKDVVEASTESAMLAGLPAVNLVECCLSEIPDDHRQTDTGLASSADRENSARQLLRRW